MKGGEVMRRYIVSTIIGLTIVTATRVGAVVNPQQERKYTVADLGPDPFYGVPDSLEKLVARVPAVVIATIGEPGELKLEETKVPTSTRTTVMGYATYTVTIRDVLFNYAQNALPLTVGSTVVFRQLVGRENAEAFQARQIPVAAGDECLLFLWSGPHGWQILNWHTQFRRSHDVPSAAEGLGVPREHLNPQWLGSSIAYTKSADVIIPDWVSLTLEVRRLSKLPR